MYSGEPIVSHLGEHYSKKTIGNIITPIGRFVSNVAYRTSLRMSTTPFESGAIPGLNEFDLEFRENHFIKDKIRRSPTE